MSDRGDDPSLSRTGPHHFQRPTTGSTVEDRERQEWIGPTDSDTAVKGLYNLFTLTAQTGMTPGDIYVRELDVDRRV